MVHKQKQGTYVSSVAVIVLNWNDYKDTAECVLSLKRTKYPNIEIILVDNGSNDGSDIQLERDFPGLKLIKLQRNGGYAAGNNAGIRFALERQAEYILILNNDVVVEPDFLSPMVALAEKNPAAGIVTCKAFFQSKNGRVYCTAGSFSWLRCAGVALAPRHREYEGEVEYISGCILLIRRDVFDTVGMLDERFFMYFEDLEFSRRVCRHFKLFYTPRGVVYHKSGGGDGWTNYTETYLYYTARNRFWVFRQEQLWYRSYVFLYSLVNALAKSLVVFIHSLSRHGHHKRLRTRLLALWQGLFDGLFKKPPQQYAIVKYK